MSVSKNHAHDSVKYFMTQGNPCAGFRDYRDFVITVLPQLKILDGTEIEISERILAKQRFAQIKESILQQEHEHCARREAERREAGDNAGDGGDHDNVNDPDDDKEEDITEKRRKYFNQRSNYTPETRVEMQKVKFMMSRDEAHFVFSGRKFVPDVTLLF